MLSSQLRLIIATPAPFISFDTCMQKRVDVVKPWNQARVRFPNFEIRYLGKEQERNRPWYIYSRIVMIHRRCLLLYVILRYKSKYKKVGVLPIRIVWSNVSSIDPSSERNSTKTFLYFDLYLYSAYAAHYVYIEIHLYTSRYLYTARFIDYTSL